MQNEVVLGRPVLNRLPAHRYIRKVLDKPNHPNAQALLEFWREHEKSGGVRMGRDIPSRALARYLPNIIIAEPLSQWDDARIRLAGTAFMERFGRDVAGELTSRLYAEDPDGAALLLKLARQAAEIRKPGMIDLRYEPTRSKSFASRRYCCPSMRRMERPAGLWSARSGFRRPH